MTAITSNNVNSTTNAMSATAPGGIWNVTTLYFRVTQAQGASANCNVYIYVQPMP